MKVCHVITSLDIGGAELVLYRLLSAQRDNVADVSVITLRPEGALAAKLRDAGFQVYSLNVSGLFSLASAVIKLVKLLQVIKPEVVQSWLYHADFIASLSSFWLKDIRYVWGIHTCQLPKGNPATWLIMKCCAFLSHRVPDKIVCVAKAAQQLHVRSGYAANKISVIPNGFAVSEYAPEPGLRQALRRELQLPSSAVIVGIIARWHADKGQDLMLEAIKHVQIANPDVIFLFVGRGCDADNTAMEQLVKACPYPEKILALGERSDIPALLNTIDVFCMPSRTEAFPLALGEAMCAALPVVATNVGDVEYMTGNLVTLAKPADSASLAECLSGILANSAEYRAQLGQNLHKRVSEHFSIEQMVKRYQQLYSSLQN
ncbi:glycosyltransferase [Rheinheimera sp. D18]|uniref:glycosyltransferase family 4 protein n=1 Tax=Rheinheimera sp. D18 TaxID=2545632 RepID=UPI00104604AB|nr:glycosyltransferase [Rheinheimera sp. D18]QBL09811.1 glycosyltransferase [Rheinheimera sp. D18]